MSWFAKPLNQDTILTGPELGSSRRRQTYFTPKLFVFSQFEGLFLKISPLTKPCDDLYFIIT